MNETGDVGPACFAEGSCPRKVRIGGISKGRLLQVLQDHNVHLNQTAEALFADPRFTTSDHRVIVEVVPVCVTELGFPEGANYEQVVAGAFDAGLVECALSGWP